MEAESATASSKDLVTLALVIQRLEDEKKDLLRVCHMALNLHPYQNGDSAIVSHNRVTRGEIMRAINRAEGNS